MDIVTRKLIQTITEIAAGQNASQPSVEQSVSTTKSPITDEEGGMAIGELKVLAQKAQELANMMKDDTQLEAWVQSKITKAKDYISSVHDYMNGNPDKVD